MFLKNQFSIHLFSFCVLLFSSCNKSTEDAKGDDGRMNVYNEVAYFSRAMTDGGLITLSSQYKLKSIDANEKNITTYFSKINSNGGKSWTINFESFKKNYNYFFPKTVNAIRGGGFIVIAQYGIADPSSKHLLWIKTDENGNINSTKEIPPNGPWKGPYFDFVQTNDDNFVLADGNKIHKLNGDPNELWLYTNASLYESYLLPTPDNGIIISSNEHGSGNTFISRLKLNYIGDLEWQKYEEDTNHVWRQTTIADVNGSDFVITGSNLDSSNLDFYVEIFSSNGDSKQFIQIPGSLNEYCHFVLPTQDGGFILIGTTTQANDIDNGVLYDDETFPDFNARMIVVKLNSNMETVWTKTYGGSYGSEGLGVSQSADGSFLLIGNQVSYSNPNVINMFVVKINNNGAL